MICLLEGDYMILYDIVHLTATGSGQQPESHLPNNNTCMNNAEGFGAVEPNRIILLFKRYSKGGCSLAYI